jgi:hypothetical protein
MLVAGREIQCKKLIFMPLFYWRHAPVYFLVSWTRYRGKCRPVSFEILIKGVYRNVGKRELTNTHKSYFYLKVVKISILCSFGRISVFHNLSFFYQFRKSRYAVR